MNDQGQMQGRLMPEAAVIAPLSAALTARGIAATALERARKAALESGQPFHLSLSKLGLVQEGILADALVEVTGWPRYSERDLPISAVLPDQISPRFLRQYACVPLGEADGCLRLAMADPLERYVYEAVQLASGLPVVPLVATPAEIEAAHRQLYDTDHAAPQEVTDGADEADIARLKDIASEAPVIRLVNHLITLAVERGASDIHLEPAEARLRVRFRIDGMLLEQDAPPAALRAAILSRVKLMAGLDIAERRLPQDGRIKLAVRGREVDLRIATVPVLHGESIVIRILDRARVALDFAALGFAGAVLDQMRDLLARPHGIVLVTGPTGSGKTTTLYAGLSEMDRDRLKILTAEDPVEFQLEGINQVQVRPQIGLGFARVLRALLRQDPDVMMIGEIRDLETAQIATQAALTGHLVLSTLHTNDAASAVTRLMDMGLEDYLLSATLSGVLAQRLVRTLCPACKTPAPVPSSMAPALAVLRPGVQEMYQPEGCPACNDTGFSSRQAVYELMVLDDALRQLITGGADAQAIAAHAQEHGMGSLWHNGLALVAAGETSLAELSRVAHAV